MGPASECLAFPPIEIDIPDLTEYRKTGEELKAHKLDDAAWKANLESVLKRYGIFLTPVSSTCKDSQSSSSPQTSSLPPPFRSPFAPISVIDNDSNSNSDSDSGVFRNIPHIISCQTLSSEQWDSRSNSRSRECPSTSQGQGLDQGQGQGQGSCENGNDVDCNQERVADQEQNPSQEQVRDQNQNHDHEHEQSQQISSDSQDRVSIGIQSGTGVRMSNLSSASRNNENELSRSYIAAESDNDIDISEVFQYPPPENSDNSENDNDGDDGDGEGESAGNFEATEFEEDPVEHILPDTPQKSVIIRGNYPDLSITTFTTSHHRDHQNQEGETEMGEEEGADVDCSIVQENTISILPTETVTANKGSIQEMKIASQPNSSFQMNSGSALNHGHSGSKGNCSSPILQASLSALSSNANSNPIMSEDTNAIWNSMLDSGVLRPLTGTGPVFFPVRKVSPDSHPSTPTSSKIYNSNCNSDSNSAPGTPRRCVGTSISESASAFGQGEGHGSLMSNRRRPNYRSTHGINIKNMTALRSVQARLRHSGARRGGYDYVNNITADAVARSRNRSQDLEDSVPAHQKDQMEAMNHIEAISTTGKKGNSRTLYKCTLCGYQGPKDKTVLMHIRMAHIGVDRRYPCLHCTFRFKTSSHLRKHNQRKHPQAAANGYGYQSRMSRNVAGLEISEVNDGPANENRTESVIVSVNDARGQLQLEDQERSLYQNENLNLSQIQNQNHGDDPLGEESLTFENEDPSDLFEPSEIEELREAFELFHDNNGTPRYLCYFCDSSFPDYSTVISHILNSHKCSKCKSTFQDENRLIEHKNMCFASPLNLTVSASASHTNSSGNSMIFGRGPGSGSGSISGSSPSIRSRSRSGSTSSYSMGNGNGYGSGSSGSVLIGGNNENQNTSCMDLSRSESKRSRSTGRSSSTPTGQDQLNSPKKKKNKHYTTNAYTFSEPMKQFLDPKIINVKNPKPPYICTICDQTLNSTRQSARLHVRNVHFKNMVIF